MTALAVSAVLEALALRCDFVNFWQLAYGKDKVGAQEPLLLNLNI